MSSCGLKGERHRQGAELQLVREGARRLDGEVAGDAGLSVGDRGLRGRCRDDLLVEDDGELVAHPLQPDEPRRDVAELLGAVAGELQRDLDDVGRLAVLRGLVTRRRVGDVGSVDLDGAEDVLGLLVLRARDEGLGRVVDDGVDRLGLGAVELGELVEDLGGHPGGSLASVGVAVGVAVPVEPAVALVGAGVGSAISACGMARFAEVAALVAWLSGVNAGGGVVAVELGVPVPVVSVPVAVPVAAACGEPASAARTARNRSCEGLRMASSVAASAYPGSTRRCCGRPGWSPRPRPRRRSRRAGR